MNLTTCIGCGCDDMHACPEGCTWLRVDRAACLGVCSSCPDDVARWDAGNRTLSETAQMVSDMCDDDDDETPVGFDDEEDDGGPRLILPGDPDYYI